MLMNKLLRPSVGADKSALAGCSAYWGLSAVAAATSRRTLGDIVDDNTTLFIYVPFAPLGRARTTASITDVIFDIKASSLKDNFPAGICNRAVLSTLNSTRPAFTS